MPEKIKYWTCHSKTKGPVMSIKLGSFKFKGIDAMAKLGIDSIGFLPIDGDDPPYPKFSNTTGRCVIKRVNGPSLIGDWSLALGGVVVPNNLGIILETKFPKDIQCIPASLLNFDVDVKLKHEYSVLHILNKVDCQNNKEDVNTILMRKKMTSAKIFRIYGCSDPVIFSDQVKNVIEEYSKNDSLVYHEVKIV